MRRLLIAVLVILATAATVWVWLTRDARLRPRVLNGPMVQLVTTEGFDLAWQISPDQAARVSVLGEDDREIGSFPASRADRPILPDQPWWVASVRGLQAGRTVRYRIAAASPAGREVVAAEHRVRTAPNPDGAIRFIAFGDSGSGQRAQHRIARLLPSWNPDFVVHAGDLITPSAEREYFAVRFFRPYALLMASSPFYVCLGNHDVRAERGQPVLDAFLLPANGPTGEQPERHYWFDAGPARLVAVDSNHDFPYLRDTVAPWLDTVLTGAGDRWKICFWHEPAYTHGERYPPADKLLRSLVPVLDKHGCDLVLSGHQHLYERTWPIRQGQIVGPGEGTVYVVTGAGGSNLYKARTPQAPFIAACRDDLHSFTVIDVTPEMLALRQIGAAGSQIDEYLIERPERRTPGTAPASATAGTAPAP